MNEIDRCALAYRLHHEGYNCAQSVAGAFADRLPLTREQTMAACGGFAGGIGSCREEVCGALSGGVVVLGLLVPHTDGADREGKQRVLALTKEFRRRFAEAFGGLTRCGDLLRARPAPSERTPAALRLGITAHCDVMIVTAVELIETLLDEQNA